MAATTSILFIFYFILYLLLATQKSVGTFKRETHFLSLSFHHYHSKNHTKMDYTQLIDDYKESATITSPIWIWFEKDAKCTFCNTIVGRTNSSTSCMVNRLKRKHGFLAKYNAWKHFEELH